MPRCTDHTPTPWRVRSVALLVVLAIQACAPGPARHSAPATTQISASSTQSIAGSSELARYNAALALLEEGHNAAAIDALSALIADHPGLSGALTNLGILQAQNGDQGAALASFERACKANPDNVVAHNWLASLLRKQRRYGEAEQAYLRALRAQPDDPASHRNLAVLYDVSLNQPQLALKHYRRYQQLSGDGSLIVSAWIQRLQDQSTTLAEHSSP